MKKLIIYILSIIIAFSLGACGINTGGDGETPPAAEDKNMLLFEIDEGIGQNEVTTVYGNNITAMESALQNIYDSIAPLKEKYDVAVLIYPTWHYFRDGYKGANPELPENRISPNLIRTFSFFEEKGMPVYLEMYSSGIRTSQNGEAGAVAEPYLHYGVGAPRRGISMDLEVIEYLKEEFPQTFEGIRFHELIGTNDVGLNDRNNGKEDISHGFVVEEEVLYETFKTVKKSGLKLVWGDHSWNVAFNQDDSPKKNYEYWKTWLDKGIEVVGLDDLTINWSNNGWPMHQYILEDFSLKGYKDTTHGMSIQSWFWQELDSSTTRVQYDGTGGEVVKWYKFAENEMPIDLLAAYTLKCFKEGGKLVQFEHPQYFFNYNHVSGAGFSEYSGYYEDNPDYSGRLRLKRLTDILLDPTNENNPGSDIRAYFDTDAGRLTQYKENSGAKRYYQSFAGGIDQSGAVKFYDKYNNGSEKWYENSDNRFTESLTGGEIKFATRFNANYNATTETLVVKEVSGGLVGEFYNSYSGKITSDAVTFNDNANGSVKAIMAVNAVTEYVNSVEGDPDELVVVRENSAGAQSMELYKAEASGAEASQMFKLKLVEGGAALNALFGTTGFSTRSLAELNSASIAEDKIINILPIKTRNALLKNCTKPVDGGAVKLYKSGNDYRIKGKVDNKVIDQKLELGGEYIGSFTVDTNADCKDEIAIAVKSGDKVELKFFTLGSEFTFSDSIDMGGFMPKVMFSGNFSTYYKAY